MADKEVGVTFFEIIPDSLLFNGLQDCFGEKQP